MTQDDLRTYGDERVEELAAESSATRDESFSGAIDSFLRDRLQLKLDKFKPQDPAVREALAEQHSKEVWLEDAARRARQIQAVTHSIKPIHPSARGTNLLVYPDQLPRLHELGTHALAHELAVDVVGSASALDVYKFLQLKSRGRTLLSALLDEDREAMSALHSDKARSQWLRNAFVSVAQHREGQPSSHALAKQLYWLTGSDASRDDDYTILAPLYATSLAQAIHIRVEQVRYGQANKLARQAMRENRWHDQAHRSYPALAAKSLGGAQPQNISQLNSERKGLKYLLSSQPPAAATKLRRLPSNARSVFDGVFPSRPQVRDAIVRMQASPERAAEHLETLLDELVLLTIRLHQHKPGWTLDQHEFGALHFSEQLWLDPFRAERPDQRVFAQQWLQLQWPAQVGHRFETWLDTQLGSHFDLGLAGLDWKELLTQGESYACHLQALRARMDRGQEARV